MFSPEIQHRIDDVCACLKTKVVEKDDPHVCQRLQDRMAAYGVPGVSIAVIHHGAIEWAQGFGVVQLGGGPVTPETLFQAGSISKPVAAMAALHLVEQGKLALDSDVNQALTSWKIPASAVAPGAVVTLRELLNHTAGLTVHGFPGYAAGAPIPTLVQVLDGEKPANTAAVRLEAAPGSRWKYSGGGYTVVQQLLLDISHQPFPKLMHDTVLSPIGMTRSTYEQPLPTELRSGAATPYKADGVPVEGGFHVYPEMAAAGLWTTPTDLARYAIEIQRSLRGDANRVLSAEMTKQMLVAGQGSHGLGLPIGGTPENPFFSHGGIDEGFEAVLAAYQDSGDGAVIMTNARGGQLLATEILRSIASVYGWPDFHPIIRTSVKVDPAILATYTGVYELTPTLSIAITLEHGQLMSQATHQRKLQLFPESRSKFFTKVVDAQLEFLATDAGHISHLILHQNGNDMRGERKQ
ncbi:serine hydrolase [Bradyrhizobium sp. Gha]|uniref:serine hydrolase n=1 Tax=Bradyrhizobium sp. Gha TaxID=1855318 RepID=UPI0008E1AA33|nr:serine hydrolase [Bradyrhizobium sp. Gha]SFH80417.1 CubicO group peptidase, beta-lactamase class C family [Bradyrhizobium sp. Gha]